jgi:hypothetical protein
MGREQAAGKPTLVHQLEEVIESAKGAVIRDIFGVLNKAMGGKGGAGGKLTTMMSKEGTHICEPEEVREMAAKHGARTLAAGDAAPDVVGEILRELLPARLQGGETEQGEGLQKALEWDNFQHALGKCKARKGVGIDGFNAHLLQQAPGLQEGYWRALKRCVQEKVFRDAWKQWVAMVGGKVRLTTESRSKRRQRGQVTPEPGSDRTRRTA